MLRRRTEQLHKAARGLDELPLAEVAVVLAHGQVDAVSVLPSNSDGLALGGALMAQVIRDGGRLHYIAAGSSGLMAMADACELAGTFGIAPSRISIHMAGGIPDSAEMPGDTEDEVATADGRTAKITSDDVAIVVSASGSTPFAVAWAAFAKAAGAQVIAIANTAGSVLLTGADVAICLQTPPEVIAGSTRLGAGTAQKAALNTMSTLMGVALGHVHDGMMVNVRADNAKLRARAIGMIATIADVDESRAADALARAEGDVKAAITLAAGAVDLDEAKARLSRANGILRHVLADLNAPG